MAFLSGISEKSVRANRARWLTAVSLSVIALSIIRLAYLQLIRGQALEEASENNHTQILVERAPRGRILDRNGQVLADDQPVFVALFSPMGLAPGELQQTLERLTPIVEIDKLELEHRLMAAVRARTMLRISDRLRRDQAFRILQDRLRLPGVSLTIEQQRYYPHTVLASHVLGYVGQITDQELESFQDRGYHPGDWIGKSGLERLYDPLLQGQDGGILIEVDALGRQVRVLRRIVPQAGKDLYLTLDKNLQELAEQRLRETRHAGAAVLVDTRSGGLLALASSPGYDPNLFLPLGNSEKRSRLLSDPELPLYNRAIQALYPPGSVFKIVSSLAGLEEGVIDPSERFHCTGSFTLGSEHRIFHCWKLKGHGWVNLREAVTQSCDVYFYNIAMKLGPQSTERFAKMMGLGQRTGVDLPSEKKGLLPYAWKTSTGQHWQGGDTLNYDIGQGALQVTPLQMADLAEMMANRGVLWQPYLAAESRMSGQVVDHLASPHPMSRIDLSERSWKLVNSALINVVRMGTGMAAQLQNVEVAGKTGTAQVTKGKDHGWFVAYAPADQPQVACAVVVEHGGHGGTVAAPIAHDLIATALGVELKEGTPARLNETQAD